MSTDDVVIPCSDLGEALRFFTDRLGFRLDAIEPADDPCEARLSGHDLRIVLRRGVEAPAARPGRADWTEGRAGMHYRDLLPERMGGRVIASHIRVPAGGPVPDAVHFHDVRFQLIFCWRGWVRLVYEDQGEPFVLEAGDAVLQPPGIRHRVLEASPGLEVIEVACPAGHATHIDHEMALPTQTVRAKRRFRGQCFVRHEARSARWTETAPGFDACDTGIREATDDLASVRVIRRAAGRDGDGRLPNGKLALVCWLSGSARAEGEDGSRLEAGDARVLPAGSALLDPSDDLQLLWITLPDEA